MTAPSCIRHRVELSNGALWLDLNLADPSLDEVLSVHIPDWTLLRSNFVAEGSPVGYLEHEGGLFLAFRGADLAPGAIPENLIALRAWCDGKTLITASRRRTQSVRDLVERLDKGWDPEDPVALLFSLAKRLAFHLAPLQAEFEDELDSYEDELLANSGDEQVLTDAALGRLRRRIVALRRRILTTRRGVLPQIALLDDLEEDEPTPLVDDPHVHLLQEARQRFSRHLEDLDGRRDRTMLLAEEVASLQEERTNRRTYIFTVVAGVFLPLGFVTGLLGINVGGMPGADDPLAFWWVAGGLALLGLGLWLRLRDTR